MTKAKEEKKYHFRSQAQRLAEWKLVCRNLGDTAAERNKIYRAGADQIKRVYADLMRAEKRRAYFENGIMLAVGNDRRKHEGYDFNKTKGSPPSRS